MHYGPSRGSLILTRRYSDAEKQTRRDYGRGDKGEDSMCLSKPVLQELLKHSEEIVQIAELRESGYEMDDAVERKLGPGHVFRQPVGSKFSTIQRVLSESQSPANASHTREVIFQCVTFLKEELVAFVKLVAEAIPHLVNLMDMWKNRKHHAKAVSGGKFRSMPGTSAAGAAEGDEPEAK